MTPQEIIDDLEKEIGKMRPTYHMGTPNKYEYQTKSVLIDINMNWDYSEIMDIRLTTLKEDNDKVIVYAYQMPPELCNDIVGRTNIDESIVDEFIEWA